MEKNFSLVFCCIFCLGADIFLFLDNLKGGKLVNERKEKLIKKGSLGKKRKEKKRKEKKRKEKKRKEKKRKEKKRKERNNNIFLFCQSPLDGANHLLEIFLVLIGIRLQLLLDRIQSLHGG